MHGEVRNEDYVEDDAYICIDTYDNLGKSVAILDLPGRIPLKKERILYMYFE